MRAFWAALLCAAAVLTVSSPGWALSFYWGSHPDKERLVFQFKASLPAEYDLTRTGRRELSLVLPSNTVQTEPWPERESLNGTEILRAIEPEPDRILIRTKTAAFGFVRFELQGENKLVVDLFSDTMGASWEETAPKGSSGRTPKEPSPENGSRQEDEGQASVNQSSGGSSQERLQAEPSDSGESSTASQAPTRKAVQEEDRETGNNASNKPQASIRRRIKPEKEQPKRSSQRTEPVQKTAPQEDYIKHRSPGNDTESQGTTIRRRVSHTPAPKVRSDSVFIQEITTSPPPQLEQSSNETQETEQHPAGEPREGKQPKPEAKSSKQEEQKAPKQRSGRGNQTAASSAAEPGNVTEEVVPSPSLVSQGNGTGLAKVLAQNATRKVKYEQVIREAKGAMNSGEYAKAANMFDALASDPHLPRQHMEEILYLRGDALFQKHRHNLKDNYLQVVSALEEAINYQPSSSRVPQALMRLFLVNLEVGNVPEAKGYFNLLRSEYQGDQNIPSAHVYLGNYYQERGDYQQAAKHYRTVVEDFPGSAPVAQAAIGLVRSLKEMELFREAWDVVQYINKRWPKRYLKDPDILRLSGYIALKQGELSRAKSFYWQYYNVAPRVQNEDLLLARFGDVYLRMGEKEAAKKMYTKAANRYPDQEGGLISKMRLAEEGIHDKPGLKDMFSVFDQPYTLKPKQVYQQILKEHGDTSLAPLAQLKLAMWRLWKNQPLKALEKVDNFQKRFSSSDLASRARQVGRRALEQALSQAAKREAYARAARLWEEHESLRQPPDKLQSDSVLAAALSFWKTGEPEKALQLAKPYWGIKDAGETSENALKLMLNVYLSNQSWSDILRLTREVRTEALQAKLADQVRYARALALEQKGKAARSEPLWLEVADSKHLSQEQVGHVFYFLGQHRMEDRDWEEVYTCAQEALSSLMRTQGNQEKVLDCIDMLVEITRRSGRTLEALEWTRRYGDYISQDSEYWPAYRYKLAEVYKQAGYLNKWKNTLQGLQRNHPQTYFGQMAAADLEEQALNQQANDFLQ